VAPGLKRYFCRTRPLLVGVKTQTGAQKTRKMLPRLFGPRMGLKSARRGRFMQKRHFSPAIANIPTRPMWQFWTSEMLQKRLSNASVTLQQHRPAAYIFSSMCISIVGGRMASRQGVVEYFWHVRECAWQQLCATADPKFTPLN
jgi:hypothetical protein